MFWLWVDESYIAQKLPYRKIIKIGINIFSNVRYSIFLLGNNRPIR